MKLNPNQFKANFPPGEPIPEMLDALLEFQNAEPSGYSGYFFLTDWPFGMSAWFAGDEVAAKQFVVFGKGSDGSLYALWLYARLNLEEAPVVFLGSEGTDCGLIAANLREFLALLAIGADELGLEVSGGCVNEGEEPADRIGEFRDWLRSRFGIEAPTDPMHLVANARKRRPDFGAWLSAWLKGRG